MSIFFKPRLALSSLHPKMASIPPKRNHRPPQSTYPQTSEPSSQIDDATKESEISSQTAEASSTNILSDTATSQRSMSRPSSPRMTDARRGAEPRKCWICFSEEDEEDEPSSEWRSPCTCALTAHESCLLDWVADIEAPNTRRTSGTPAKVTCPQCKSEIKLSRPRSLVVDSVRILERVAGRMVLPGALFATT